jgi:predicted phosphodiesterase
LSTFLHLSDIHLRRNAGSPLDGNKDLRNELERDAADLCKELGAPDAVLISGDLAFSGQVDEYARAKDWLDKLSAILRFEPEDVCVIPGNHDVDRKAIEKSTLIRDIHKNLRASAQEVDEKLAGYIEKDTEASQLIYRSIRNFNDFAAKFQCEIGAERPFWERDYKLNDSSILRIRGVNSTLISDELDNDASFKLVLGKRQVEVSRQDGVEYLVMCHHPPLWLLDVDSVDDLLRTRARIQLFGHKHRQRLEKIDETVRLTAGATHPDQREPNWQPRYNFLQVAISQGDPREMIVKVYPRVYKEEGTKFVADFTEEGQNYREYKLLLPSWTSARATPSVTASSAVQQTHEIIQPNTTSVERGLDMMPARRLTYRFLSLPHHKKLKIAQDLGLIDDEDQGLRDVELYKRYFVRAQKAQRLPELWSAVQKEYGDTDTDNPFNAKMTGEK